MQKRYTRYAKGTDTTIDRDLAQGKNRVYFICSIKSQIIRQGSAQQKVPFIRQIA